MEPAPLSVPDEPSSIPSAASGVQLPSAAKPGAIVASKALEAAKRPGAVGLALSEPGALRPRAAGELQPLVARDSSRRLGSSSERVEPSKESMAWAHQMLQMAATDAKSQRYPCQHMQCMQCMRARCRTNAGALRLWLGLLNQPANPLPLNRPLLASTVLPMARASIKREYLNRLTQDLDGNELPPNRSADSASAMEAVRAACGAGRTLFGVSMLA